MLECLLTNKTQVAVSCLNDLDLEALSRQTEGYVARDLETVVDRAVHAHLMTADQDQIKGSNNKTGFSCHSCILVFYQSFMSVEPTCK